MTNKGQKVANSWEISGLMRVPLPSHKGGSLGGRVKEEGPIGVPLFAYPGGVQKKGGGGPSILPWEWDWGLIHEGPKCPPKHPGHNSAIWARLPP